MAVAGRRGLQAIVSAEEAACEEAASPRGGRSRAHARRYRPSATR